MTWANTRPCCPTASACRPRNTRSASASAATSRPWKTGRTGRKSSSRAPTRNLSSSSSSWKCPKSTTAPSRSRALPASRVPHQAGRPHPRLQGGPGRGLRRPARPARQEYRPRIEQRKGRYHQVGPQHQGLYRQRPGARTIEILHLGRSRATASKSWWPRTSFRWPSANGAKTPG